MKIIHVALATIVISILVIGYKINLETPLLLGDIEFALLEVCEDKDTISLPIKWGKSKSINTPDIVEFINENNITIGVALPVSTVHNSKFIGVCVGRLNLNFKLINKSLYSQKISKINFKYNNRVTEYLVSNFTIVIKKAKYKELIKEDLYSKIWLCEKEKNKQSVIVFNADKEQYTIDDLGIIAHFANNEHTPFTVINNSQSEAINLSLYKHKKKFQLLQTIVKTNKGYISSSYLTSSDIGCKYLKGTTIRSNHE